MSIEEKDKDTSFFQPSNSLSKAIRPLLTSLGWRGEDQSLIEAMPNNPDDITLDGLLDTMANLGYHYNCVHRSIHRISQRELPCLFIPKDGKVTVIVKSDHKHIFGYDTENENYKVFEDKRKSGQCFLFSRLSESDRTLDKDTSLWTLKLARRFTSLFGICLMISFLLSLLAFVTPLFIMTVYNRVFASGAIDAMKYLGFGILIYLIADLGLNMMRSSILSFISSRIGYLQGNQLMRRILYFPSKETEGIPLNLQLNKLKDFEAIKDFFGSPTMATLIELPFLALLIGGMYALAGTAALIPILAIAIYLVFVGCIYKTVNNYVMDGGIAMISKQDFLLEILSNLRAIKYTATKLHWEEKYASLSAESAISNYKSGQVNAIVSAVSGSIVSVAGILTIGFAVTGVISGEMSSGALMACMLLVWRILGPLRNGFGTILHALQIYRGVGQLDKFMELEIESPQDSYTSSKKKLNGNIYFHNVTHRYNRNAHPALYEVNFEVKPKESLLIMGHDGAGKSTILKMIMGLYTSQSGVVAVDNTSIRQTNPIELRKAITYVQAEPSFVHGSIYENLRLVNLNASEFQLEEALKRAGVWADIIELENQGKHILDPLHLDSYPAHLLKRINTARLFLQDCSIMLIDEPDRSLQDSHHTQIIKGLSTFRESATLVVVSNNPRYFDLADHILWMDQGRIREFGRKEEVEKVCLEYLSN